MWEKYYPDGEFEPIFFRWGSPERNNTEILKIISDTQIELHGDPWMGKQVEKDWAKWMFECIETKTNKLNSQNFSIFNQNFLLIYDNLPQTKNDLILASSLLFKSLNNYFIDKKVTIYSKILIESKNKLLEITPQNYHFLKIKNI